MKKLSAILSVALLLAAAGCGGGSSSSSSQSSTAPESSAAAASSPQAVAASASDGAKVFDANCSSCHGAKGEGIAGAIPPLADNPTVTGDPTKPIHIVKYGLTGQISVNGHSFNGQMPNWGKTLSDAQIAAVLTYARSSWGNKASAISAAQVAAVKQ